jgi:hypothetical protein
MALTGAEIKALIQGSNNIDDYCDRLARAIVNHIEVKIPAGAVLIAADAGVPNPSPISCQIS